ncbi:hypothetical protein H0H92_003924, partial [Tricholoma furcatifolium]
MDQDLGQEPKDQNARPLAKLDEMEDGVDSVMVDEMEHEVDSVMVDELEHEIYSEMVDEMDRETKHETKHENPEDCLKQHEVQEILQSRFGAK